MNVYVVQCELCKEEVAKCRLKSIVPKLRKHRTTTHADHVGPINYKTTLVEGQVDDSV